MRSTMRNVGKHAFCAAPIILFALSPWSCSQHETTRVLRLLPQVFAQESHEHKSGLLPAPVFELRPPAWAVPEIQPGHYIFGKPESIRFVGFSVTQLDDKIERKKRIDSPGFVKFDLNSRLLARGEWQDGSITETRFAYANDDILEQLHIIRNGKELGDGTVYRYSDKSGAILVELLGLRSGRLLGTELQTFDSRGRMIESTVFQNNSGVQFKYKYGEGASPSEILELYPDPKRTGAYRKEEQTILSYDQQGRTRRYTNKRFFGSTVYVRTIFFTYDQSGNVITATYGEGKDARSTRFEYKFDEKGNWIDRIEMPVSGLGGGSESGYEVERTITYWD